MFTGAKAMAVQNYLAVKSQRQILDSEIKRERWEMDNVPEAERREIEDVYKAKGFTGQDLEKIVNKITSDKKVWLDTMLTEELKLNLEIVGDRKSTRLNSSHVEISYAVFCLKKKKK